MYKIFPGILLVALNISAATAIADPIDRAIIYSNDEAKVAKVRALFRENLDETMLDVQLKKLKVEISSTPMGLVLIDPNLPIIEDLLQSIRVLQDIEDCVGDDSVIRMASIPASKRNTMRQLLDRCFPPNSRQDGFQFDKSGIGLNFTRTVELRGADGTTRNVTLPMPKAQEDRRNAAMDAFLMPQSGKTYTDDERKNLMVQSQKTEAEKNHIDCHMIGKMKSNAMEGMREGIQILDKFVAKYRQLLMQAGSNLLGKAGLGDIADGVTSGQVDPKDLDAKIRDQVQRQLANSWQGLGFTSASEADSFFQGATGARVSLNIGLYRKFGITQSGANKVGVGMIYNIAKVNR
jgi:hypothetical protein